MDAELRGDKRALKTNSWDTRRVWWAPMLTRGKLHVDVLPPDFAGVRPDGAEVFVERLRVGLNRRFPNAEGPRVVFVDRGEGFYNPGDGQITWQLKAALQRHGLRAFMRDDASVQPGHLADLMLHETAGAWIRRQERQTLPARPLEEARDAFATRLKGTVADIKRTHNVEQLGRDLPTRVATLCRNVGDKLRYCWRAFVSLAPT